MKRRGRSRSRKQKHKQHKSKKSRRSRGASSSYSRSSSGSSSSTGIGMTDEQLDAQPIKKCPGHLLVFPWCTFTPTAMLHTSIVLACDTNVTHYLLGTGCLGHGSDLDVTGLLQMAKRAPTPTKNMQCPDLRRWESWLHWRMPSWMHVFWVAFRMFLRSVVRCSVLSPLFHCMLFPYPHRLSLHLLEPRFLGPVQWLAGGSSGLCGHRNWPTDQHQGLEGFKERRLDTWATRLVST